MASQRHISNANASIKRMSTSGSSASPAFGASGTSSATAPTTPGVNPDKAMSRLLYAMLKQKSLKDIDWNQVAADPVLLEGISNGHAARMRYSRFRNSVENSKAKARQPKDTKTCNKVTKRRSVGARRVDSHTLDDNKDGSVEDKDVDGDTEEDDEDSERRKETRYPTKAVKQERQMPFKACADPTAGLETMKHPKQDPELVDFQASFSSLPSPPMELEDNVGALDECPLIGTSLFQVDMHKEHEHDRLHVVKKRKAGLNSPSFSTNTALHQMPQALPQARQMLGYSLPQPMSVGLGLSSGPSRIHSMPMMGTPQPHGQQSQLSSYPGSVLMMRHHSAEHTHPGLLGPRTRLLTPSSDDLHQHNHHNILHKPITNADVDEYFAFGTPFSAVASVANTNASISDGATPHAHAQWTTTTPFASPLLDGTLDGTLDMSPYIAPGMDFAAVGDGGMDMMGSMDANTSLFALVGDGQQQQQQQQQQAQGQTNQQQYLSAFAKHSSGWDVMISQGHV